MSTCPKCSNAAATSTDTTRTGHPMKSIPFLEGVHQWFGVAKHGQYCRCHLVLLRIQVTCGLESGAHSRHREKQYERCSSFLKRGTPVHFLCKLRTNPPPPHPPGTRCTPATLTQTHSATLLTEHTSTGGRHTYRKDTSTQLSDERTRLTKNTLQVSFSESSHCQVHEQCVVCVCGVRVGEGGGVCVCVSTFFRTPLNMGNTGHGLWGFTNTFPAV
jgi:hypothetical protein